MPPSGESTGLLRDLKVTPTWLAREKRFHTLDRNSSNACYSSQRGLFHLPIRNHAGWHFSSLCYGSNQIIRGTEAWLNVQSIASGWNRCQLSFLKRDPKSCSTRVGTHWVVSVFGGCRDWTICCHESTFNWAKRWELVGFRLSFSTLLRWSTLTPHSRDRVQKDENMPPCSWN